MKDIQAGNYIVNKLMGMEGIVIERTMGADGVKLLCTKDEVYPPNIGQTITFNLHESWEIDNNRKFR
tara:strand:- start:278 stop:478 length:201 start_codon:yes stop_codon:yes gene_type:complete